MRIDTILESPELNFLKKLYDNNKNDRNIVVVITESSDVNINETINLHKWLESTKYRFIPSTWETENGNSLTICHITEIPTSEVLRLDPFTNQPVQPNSWINKLNLEEFEMLIYAQEIGDVKSKPTTFELQTYKSIFQSIDFLEYRQELLRQIKFAKSNRPSKNVEEQKYIDNWNKASKCLYYSSNVSSQNNVVAQEVPTNIKQFIKYDWGSYGKWNDKLTSIRDFILTKYQTNENILVLANEILGTTINITIDTARNTAHSFIRECSIRNKLDELAYRIDYTPNMESLVNQTGIVMNQINVAGDLTISNVRTF